MSKNLIHFTEIITYSRVYSSYKNGNNLSSFICYNLIFSQVIWNISKKILRENMLVYDPQLRSAMEIKWKLTIEIGCGVKKLNSRNIPNWLNLTE